MPPKRKSRKVEQIQPTLPVLRPPSPQTNTPDNTSNRRAQESQEIPNATIVGTQLRVMADASQLSPSQWQQVEIMRNSRLQATSSINLPATHQAPPMMLHALPAALQAPQVAIPVALQAIPEVQYTTADLRNENPTHGYPAYGNQTIQVVSEESNKQNQWIRIRESLIGTHQHPEATPKLQQFLQKLAAGHVSINAVEEERYQVINAYMSHWIQFALYRSPESYQAAVAMDYRLFLAEIASLYVSTDMRKRGFFDPPNFAGLAQSFTLSVDDLLSYKPEMVKNAAGDNFVSAIVAYQKNQEVSRTQSTQVHNTQANQVQHTQTNQFHPAPSNQVRTTTHSALPPQSNIYCNFCKKNGHTYADCRTRIRNASKPPPPQYFKN